MGESRAGDAMIIFAIIFFIMSVILFVFQNASSDITYTGGGGVGDYNVTGIGECGGNKVYIAPDGEEKNANKFNTRCKYTRAVDEESCENINGCEWNTTTIFWFWESQEQSCTGNINISYYDDNLSDSFFSTPIICTLDNLDDDPEACYLIGCEYSSVGNQLESSVGLGDIFAMFGDLFTLRYDFGLSSSVINGLLNFFVFYIPLLGFIISLYFSLPFLH